VPSKLPETGRFPFGAFDEQELQETQVALGPGESMVMFSDGFEDAYDEDTDDRFREERIERMLREHDLTAHEMVETLVGAIQDLIGQSAQF
jgi:serine phosphatase RsbU (regulator of sigma subunit)